MNPTNETLALIVKAMKTPVPELAKDWNQASSAVSGITAYDLEPAAKLLYPVITPLRNSIPRTSGKGGIQANWRGITGINVNNQYSGIGQGNRNATMQSSTKDYFAAYRSIGLEDFVTFEADLAAEGFDDLKALAVEGLLRALMISEEKIILGGQSSWGLGTTPTPTLATITTGGALPATTAYYVACVALTSEGYYTGTVVGGINGTVTRTNVDGSTDVFGGGSAIKSATATITTGAGSTNSIQATVTQVQGAVAYAWFWAPTTAANVVLGAITTINSINITANATGTQLLSAVPGATADNSINNLEFDGLVSFAANPANGAYFASQATGAAGTGTPLTADGAGGIVEIDAALKHFWDTLRLTPTEIYVNSQEQNNISFKVLNAVTSTAAQRFTFQVKQDMLAGGIMVRSYLNKFAMDGAVEIPIKLHPNLAPGTILFNTEKLPYPLSNVSNVHQIRARRDYYQIEWPQITRKYQYGVYADEVLQNYFPPAGGVICNIGNG